MGDVLPFPPRPLDPAEHEPDPPDESSPDEIIDPADAAADGDEARESEASDGAGATISREIVRSRRKRVVRAKTVSIKRMTKKALEFGRLLLGDTSDLPTLPETRGECTWCPTCQEYRDAAQGWVERLACGHRASEAVFRSRPCLFVSCRHSLYLDVSERTGAIKFNLPDLEPAEVDAQASCSLDVADQGGTTLEDVGEMMNITRERIRQVEVKALAHAAASKDMVVLREYVGGGGDDGKRRLPVLPHDELEAPTPIVTDGWRKEAILARLAAGDATLTELRKVGRYANRAGVRWAILDLMREDRVHRVAPGVYRLGAASKLPIKLPPVPASPLASAMRIVDHNPEGDAPPQPVRVATVTQTCASPMPVSAEVAFGTPKHAELDSAREEDRAMGMMQDKALEYLRGECASRSTEEVRAAIGSNSTNSIDVMLGRAMKLGLVVRVSPGHYAAKEHANAIGTVLDPRVPSDVPSSTKPRRRNALVQLPKKSRGNVRRKPVSAAPTHREEETPDRGDLTLDEGLAQLASAHRQRATDIDQIRATLREPVTLVLRDGRAA
jgi:Sigma-70, region 4